METYADILGIYTTEGFKAAQKRSKKLLDVSDDMIDSELMTKEFQQFLYIILRDADRTFRRINSIRA